MTEVADFAHTSDVKASNIAEGTSSARAIYTSLPSIICPKPSSMACSICSLWAITQMAQGPVVASIAEY